MSVTMTFPDGSTRVHSSANETETDNHGVLRVYERSYAGYSGRTLVESYALANVRSWVTKR